MKKLILVFAAITISAGAFALTPSTNEINGQHDVIDIQKDSTNEIHPDGFMMKDGKMMKVKDGKVTTMDRDITMSNGTKIMRDGTFMPKDGTKMKMKEGQHIDMDGNISFVNKNRSVAPDSTKNNQKK